MVTSAGKLDPLQTRVLETLAGVDPPFVLIEKLCALLSRSELRDLIDVEALVESGEDLKTEIAEAPRRDSGFSPLTLAWVLRELDVKGLAAVIETDAQTVERLDDFRRSLIERLIAPSC